MHNQLFQGIIHVANGKIAHTEPADGFVEIRSERFSHRYDGAFACAGLVDSHAHVFGLGIGLSNANLSEAQSEAQVVRMLANSLPTRGDWIMGNRWNQELWDVPSWPSRNLLDEAFPSVPVALRRVDGHALWVNSEALRRAGVDAATPNPPGGEILKDEKGNPTGVLIDEAMSLVLSAIPEYTPEQQQAIADKAATACASMGLTEVHDMDVHPALLPLWRAKAEEGSLPIRLQSYVSGQKDEWSREGLLPAVGEFLRVAGIKLYSDGALGSRGALLLEPYSDAPTSLGLALLSEELMLQKVEAITEAGFDVAIHAIGDAAVRSVLNVYEKVRKNTGTESILRIEHAQNVHPDDLPRIAQYDVRCAVQPIHCTSDAPMARKRLAERCRYAYPWRSLLSAGARIAGGSDFPIESGNPFLGIDAFVRRTPEAEDIPWFAEECLSRAEALAAYTSWAHALADQDYRRGTIAPGFDADITVVDRNILTCPQEDIASTQAVATYAAGIRRHEA